MISKLKIQLTVKILHRCLNCNKSRNEYQLDLLVMRHSERFQRCMIRIYNLLQNRMYSEQYYERPSPLLLWQCCLACFLSGNHFISSITSQNNIAKGGKWDFIFAEVFSRTEEPWYIFRSRDKFLLTQQFWYANLFFRKTRMFLWKQERKEKKQL